MAGVLLNFHPKVLKYVTEAVICPSCHAPLIYSPDNHYYTCQKTCKLDIYLLGAANSKVFGSISFGLAYPNTIGLYCDIDFEANTMHFMELTKAKRNPFNLTIKSIPQELEFTEEYFLHKIPLWLTFS